MITVPLYFFLFVYYIFLFFFFLFIFVNISHLVHTGALTITSFFVTVIMIALTTAVFIGTYQFLLNADWQYPVMIWNSSWFGIASTYNAI